MTLTGTSEGAKPFSISIGPVTFGYGDKSIGGGLTQGKISVEIGVDLSKWLSKKSGLFSKLMGFGLNAKWTILGAEMSIIEGDGSTIDVKAAIFSKGVLGLTRTVGPDMGGGEQADVVSYGAKVDIKASRVLEERFNWAGPNSAPMQNPGYPGT